MRTGSSGTTGAPEIVVVGAGPAGLAVAACLKRENLSPVILDRGSEIATRWHTYYKRLHLNTSKRLSRLPGLSFNRSDGRWPARVEVIDYLERFADRYEIRPRFGVTVQRIDLFDGRLVVTTNEGTLDARAIVVATGQSERPVIPAWPGSDTFHQPILHVSRYAEPSPYRGKDVLVVGGGDSASDVAVDLVEGGARKVWLSIRTPPHIVPRQLLGIPADVTAAVATKFPPKLVDPIIGRLARLVVGDLRRYGLPFPEHGMYAHHLYNRRAPIVDPGHFVRGLRDRSIEIVEPLEGFEGEEAVLIDGSKVTPDAVIAATGYSPGLEPIVGHLGVLAPDGYPIHHAPDVHPALPRLYFLGFRYPFAGNFRQIRLDAPKVARRIGAALDTAEVPAQGRPRGKDSSTS